ncbi:hypothetical protein AB833_20735 [Chromatiales bacterium (ex Bugula neritina AB1)]|nr:hypothetical protein AB833_20735 [Chromatiales bacterium (ex Bugula neritina AB1)]
MATDSCDCKTDDFPTVAIADYVLGCMAANGNSVESLHQCSCSVDFIKSKMSYAEFEEAQTIMQVQLDRGQRGIFFRDSHWAKERVKTLQKYQAESTLLCF